MKRPLFRLRPTRLLVVLAPLFMPVAGMAQRVDKAPENDRTAILQESIQQAEALFRAGRASQGETALLAANTTRRGTPAWYVESAYRLYTLALRMRGQREGALAITVGERAFDHLAQALTLYRAKGDSKGEAQVHEMQGMLYEQLLRDPASALAEYEAAGRLDRTERNAAAVKRLETTVAAAGLNKR